MRRLGAWVRRHWVDLVALVVAVAAAAGVLRWRQGQLAGHGLRAVYYETTDFKQPFQERVEPAVDLTSERDAVYDERGPFSVEWSGYIVVPTAGHYRFAIRSDDGSWIQLDGRPLVRNGGVHPARERSGVRELSAGAHAIRVRYFEAGAGGQVRMLWKPHGRRGDWEYIPPTLLFPDEPDEATVRQAHAVPPRDLPALLGLVACALGLGLVWARRWVGRSIGRLGTRRRARLDLVVFAALFAGALGLRLWDLSAAGQTWDEDVYWSAGRNYVQNVLALDLRADSWAWNNEHPAVAKLIYGAATLAGDSFEPARQLSAVLGALTCALLFLVGRDLAGRRVGAMGAALAIVLPHLLAHHKIIGLETPSGLLYTLAVWLMYRGLEREGNTGLHLWAGVAAGLAAGVRVTNLSVVLVLVALYLRANWPRIRDERAFPLPVTLGLLPVAAAVVFVGTWPYLWDNPLQHLGEMLSHWKPDLYLEHFLGERVEPPLYYFPLYFVVTTPVVLLPAMALGLARVAARRTDGQLALFVWTLAPFVVMLSPMARDGVRYLFPALLPACLLAASGAEWLATGVTRWVRRPAGRDPLTAALGVGMGLYVVYGGLHVHPYYLDYYNKLVGGPAEVARRQWFEIGWWGEGLEAAADYVSRVAPQNARVNVMAHPTHVVRLRPDLIRVPGAGADFIIFNRLFNPPARFPGYKVVHVVRAGRAPLVWVYQRADLAPEALQ